MRREQIFHRLRADTPFQRAIDVRVEFLSREARAFIESQMQAEQAPSGVLKVVDLLKKRGGQLFSTGKRVEGLMHVERGRNKLPRPYGAAICQLDSRGTVIFDDDMVDIDLWLEGAASCDECFH